MRAWKEILNLDLTRLLFRRPAPDIDGTPPVYWWTRISRLLGGHHQSGGTARAVDPLAISPRLVHWAGRPGWKGPVYWNVRLWHRDVVLVSEHLRSLIACNAPLAPGLSAAALEESRLRTAWTPQRASALARNIVLVLILIALGSGIASNINGLNSGMGFFQAFLMVAIAGYLIRAIFLNRASRLGVFVAMEKRIASGASLSEAMGALPRFFPRHLVDLIETGELSGDFEPAFAQFNENMLHALGLQRQLKATLAYLGIVLFAQLSIASFLLVKVIPVFVEIRQEIAAESPGISSQASGIGSMVPWIGAILPDLNSLTGLAAHIVTAGPLLVALVVLVAMVLLLGRFRRRRSWASRRSTSVFLKLPWFHGLAVRHNLGLIALMLHGLLRAGVPLDRALALALGSDVHPAYRRWLGALRERVCQGESLREAFARVPARGLIPESFRGLIEAGERSGQLPEMLERVAGLYRRETEKRLQILHAVVLPGGIFVLGYLVMSTQVSVFRVLIELAESIHA